MSIETIEEGRKKNGSQDTVTEKRDEMEMKDESLYSLVPMYGEHKRAVSSVIFAPSHWLCGSSSADGTVKIWDVSGLSKKPASLSSNIHPGSVGNNSTFTGHCTQSTALQTMLGHARGINHLDWSPRTGEYVATASDDKTCRIWDVSTAEALVELKGHSNFVFSVKFNPQSNLLVSGSFDETLKIWDVRSGSCVSTLPAHSDPVTSVDWNRDGTCVVSSSYDGLIRIWDVATGECLKTIYADGNPPVSYVRYSPNGKFILSATLDSKIRLWNVGNVTSTHISDSHNCQHSTDKTTVNNHTKKCTKTYSGGHKNTKYCIFSDFCTSSLKKNEKHSVVTGSEDGSVVLYDLQSRTIRQKLSGVHTDAVLAVAAHSKVDLIASGGMTNDKTVRFWATNSLMKK